MTLKRSFGCSVSRAALSARMASAKGSPFIEPDRSIRNTGAHGEAQPLFVAHYAHRACARVVPISRENCAGGATVGGLTTTANAPLHTHARTRMHSATAMAGDGALAGPHRVSIACGSGGATSSPVRIWSLGMK
jgi:hypothetical protein